MARFSSNPTERQHVAKIAHEMPLGGDVTLVLLNGTEVSGTIAGWSGGNSFGQPGPLQYRGEVTLQLPSRQRVTVDYLDIQQVIPVQAPGTSST